MMIIGKSLLELMSSITAAVTSVVSVCLEAGQECVYFAGALSPTANTNVHAQDSR